MHKCPLYGLKLEYICLRTRCAHHPRDFNRHMMYKGYNLWRPPAQISFPRAANSACVWRFSVINGAALVSTTPAIPQHPFPPAEEGAPGQAHQQRQRASGCGGSASYRYLPPLCPSTGTAPRSRRVRPPFPAPRSSPRRRSACPASARNTAQAPHTPLYCCSSPSCSSLAERQRLEDKESVP